jgi:membrane-bound lytic murein transglycosylase MltF
MRRARHFALLVAALALGGCGGRDDASGSGKDGSPWSAEHTPYSAEDVIAGDSLIEFAREPWKGDLGGMVERRMVRVLVVPSRTHYWLELGKHSGIEYELTAAFEAWLNERHKGPKRHLRLRFVYVPTTVDRLIPDLRAGHGDIGAAMLTVTPERSREIDFSAPYARGVREVVVTGPASAPLASLQDLSGRKVFVRRSSSYWTHLEALNETFRKSKQAEIELVAVPEVLSDDEILEMVNAGLVSTTVVDFYEARIWRKAFTDLVVHEDMPLNDDGELAWMIRKGSPELSAALAEFMQQHRHGTSFGNTVERKYVGSASFVKRATSSEDAARLQTLRELFEKYGEQYSLDWVLLAAQAYQESRLDQGARSGAGAVGIMQLMPATARPLGVGDISKVEPNIHAGAKYSRQIRDQYFSDEGIDEFNKGLFTVAAYNAGPARIEQLRRLTAERGLDPNVWFGNVEVLAAEKIGAETVGYVANIFKYYVGFKLAFRQVDAGEQLKESARGQAELTSRRFELSLDRAG